jgi:hypothetical protein
MSKKSAWRLGAECCLDVLGRTFSLAAKIEITGHITDRAIQ